ncbi:hypothetical protein [Paraliomyxa miuraensis]|uniref:hypothetical protein n=1 Tax=Paraliomyxa miuraensis TaxID=376150 RepID=UPI002251A100|nr:hypothetical protein [Paraliomyxa miuraensis]MCX4247407.1 hypothetical protein [Paraliomyxa miuraensis]
MVTGAPRLRAPVPWRMAWLVPLACGAIASCNTPRHVAEVPSLGGPMMSGSSWWIPQSPWTSGLPCGADDDPVPNVDIDDDGVADGFALGRPTTDDRGHTVQLVCIHAEAHLIVDGKSVGKCPWLGGRNHVYAYYEDEDCDGDIDDHEGNGRPDELGWTVLVSMDGPLPPIRNVSLGEWAMHEGEVVPITAENYAELEDDEGRPIDNDRDGLVDVTAYDYHGELVTKRHFEIDPNTGVITEHEDDEVRFEPTAPYLVPDDIRPYRRRVAAGGRVPSVGLASVGFARASRLDAAANVPMDADQLPPGMVSQTSQLLAGAGAPHEIAVRIVDGLPLGIVTMRGGFVLRYVPLRSTGSIRLRIDASTRTDRGWAGVPTVLLDGDLMAGAVQEVGGAVIVDVRISAAHGGELEVRFGEG